MRVSIDHFQCPFRLTGSANRGLTVVFLFAFLEIAAHAQTPWNGSWPPPAASNLGAGLDASVPLSAVVQETPPTISITLHRPGQYDIYRKSPDAASWGVVVATVPPGSTHYVDNNVAIGSSYEYKFVLRDYASISDLTPNSDPTGYLLAGIRLDTTAPRGRLVLAIADNLLTRPDLSAEIDIYQSDLVADGWTVHRLVVPRATNYDGPSDNNTNGILDHIELRASIQALAASYPGELRQIVLLGRVPTVRTGSYTPTRPDGHGTLYTTVTDAYYADLDGTWNDAITNAHLGATGPDLNTPGDGKFDPSNVTGISGPNQTIELGFGRIDFSLALTSELDATLHYLRKLHRYKIADASFAPGRAALIRSGYDAVEEAGWGSLPAIVGPASLRTLDVAALPSDPSGRLDGDALIARDSGPFLFYFRGNGQPSHAPSARAVFWTGMQSNWGYWYNNSTMPSRLAEDNWALSFTWQIWGTRYAYHRLSLGAHTGEMMRATLNSGSASSGLYAFNTAELGNGDFQGYFFLQHMGDPTLRPFVVAPPTGLSASPTSGGQTLLSWTPSPDSSVLGYHVYSSSSADGPFTRLTPTPVAASNYSVSAAPSSITYFLVRSVKLETSGAGTFLLPSLGARLTVDTGEPLPVSFSASPEPATFQSFYTYQFESNTGRLPIKYALVSGELPPGLDLSADGRLSGLPARGGEYAFLVSATDYLGTSVSTPVSMVVTPPAEHVISPEADAYVNNSSSSRNFGITDGLYATNTARESFLRFDVSSFPTAGRILSARLRLFSADSSSTSSLSLAAHLMADSADGWIEGAKDNANATGSEITHLNRPTEIHSSATPRYYGGSLTTGHMVEFDIADWLALTIATDPAKKLSVRITNPNNSSVLRLGSRESSPGVRPVLLVETTSGPLIVPATTTSPIYAPSGAGLWLGQTVTDEGYPSTTTHSWALLNGPGSVIFSSPNSSSTSVTFSAPGRYVLRYVADDGAQPTSRDYVAHVAASHGVPEISAGLVLRYSLDEAVPSLKAADSSGHEVPHPGYLRNGASFAPTEGRLDGALRLDGVDDYLESADAPELDGTSRLAISLWVKPEIIPTATRTLVAKQTTSSSTRAYSLKITNTGRLILDINGATAGTVTSTNDSAGKLVAGQWAHVALVYDGTLGDTGTTPSTDHRSKLYINGVLNASMTESASSIPDLPSNFFLGVDHASSTNTFFNGWLDEVRVYRDTALSQAQIALLSASAPPDTAPIVSIVPPAASTAGQPVLLDGLAADDGPQNSLTYQWEFVSGPGMAPFSTPAQEDTNVTPESGGDYLFRLLVSDGRYTSFAEVSLSAASAGNSYTLWTVSEGLVGEDASPSADPDGDGLANLLEFALNGDPKSSSSSPSPSVTTDSSGYLTLTFERARSDLTYEVLSSSNLSTWSVLATNPGSVGESVTVTDLALPSPARFLRLRVNTTE